ncbi:conserved protein of unknown function [Tenacibaculum sp. 190524A02b]|uniref:tyrosine-type recombinase/integrase n=1 Tax=Tenacibaculum vairaonense TaxID=3137860 RepID=UPI0032B2C2F7
MQGKIFLNTRKGQQLKNGAYPLICELTGDGQQKPFSLKMKFFKEDWNFEKEEPKKDKTKLFLVRKKKSLLDALLLKSLDDNTITFDYIKKALNGKLDVIEGRQTKGGKGKIDFIKLGFDLAAEKKNVVSEKGVDKEGNAAVYENALNQFIKFVPKIDLIDLDYATLVRFKNEQLKIGNKKTTISNYLRTLRAIYNEGLRREQLKVTPHPFEGLFNDISVKSNRTKKRNISKETLKILECFTNNLARGQQDAVDLFLLQFYFGGQDLFDIYYLEKKQVAKNDRVYFTRGKIEEGGYQFDLKICDKAITILQRMKKPNQGFLFSGRKDYTGYTNYRSRINKNLKIIQNNYNSHVERIEKLNNNEYHKIEVLPLGGYITTKVARHTFATIGSRLYVEPDLLRALMGHERDNVDTIYKDTYPEEERDKFHSQIIDTSGIEVEAKYVYHLEYFDENRIRRWKYRYFDEKPTKIDLLEEVTGKSYSEPRHLKKIYLIKKA